MPAIVLVSKMKSGLPKPAHTAAPKTHIPTRAVAPQLNITHARTTGVTDDQSSGLKPTRTTSLNTDQSSGPEAPPQSGAVHTQLDHTPFKPSQPADGAVDTQIYTDWANHYLAKSGHKRLIKDLQQDVSDGVLLAEIIQVVANEKIEDINGCPKSRSQMIENIDTCLAFLAAKGVNTQGLSAEEIRNGNLKAILGLFFSLSRYKQQQQQQRQQPTTHTHHTHSHSTHSSTNSTPSHGTHTHRAQAEMQSRGASESKLLKFSIGQKKSSRLPGPTARVCVTGSEGSPRGSVSSAGNRRSQAFSGEKNSKAAAPQPKESSDSVTSHPSGMTEHAPSFLATVSTSILTSTVASSSSSSSTSTCPSGSAIPQPNSSSKPWRSKSTSTKHTSTSTALLGKQDAPAKQPAPAEPPPKALPQRSMLEKLKLFNSKGTSKSSAQPEGAAASPATSRDSGVVLERVEASANTEPLDEAEGNARPANGLTSSSPKIALKGIAQRTFSRALTAKKGSTKNVEKEKEKERAKEKEKERGKEASKHPHVPASEKAELREEELPAMTEVAVPETEPKKTSKIASLIPKGGKVSSKKESSAPVLSGIPKPGGKSSGNGVGKNSTAPLGGKDNERPRSMRLGGGVGLHRDSRHSSSSSSLASTEGKAHQSHSASPVANGGTTQSTASNTVSVQLPQPQQQYSHPNTATVAPFMYRSQTEGDDSVTTEMGSGGHTGESANLSKTSIEDLSAEDPETRRLRTVKNIADLRQNLEETMSSLRGTQITHSTLETTFDSGVTTELSGRSLLSLASRPVPLAWASRVGQSSPRLQAGDAPSLGNSYQGRGGVGPAQGRYLYPTPLRRQLAARGSALCGLELGERGEELELDVSGYVSDGDVLAKNARAEEISSGYLTDGGLSLYTRRLNRLPDGMAVVRETLQRNASTGQGDADSWDDSSSVSSGISDTIDTDDINTSSSISSYANTPAAPRKHLKGQTDTEKHSAVERNSTWSGDEVKRSDGGSDSGVKMEPGSKWRRNPSDVSDESDKGSSGRKGVSVSQTGSWRRGMSAQVGVTTPRTKSATVATGTGTLKTHGTAKTDDAKVSEKGRLSPRPNGVHRSPSDASRTGSDSAPATRSDSTSSTRAPTSGSTFGFKKPGSSGPAPVVTVTTSGITLVTASGATITSGSATLGKIPKSAALVVGGGRDRSGLKVAPESMLTSQEDGYLAVSARSTLQYRSLPRPSRSGAAARHGNRSSTSSIESGLSVRAPALVAVTASKMQDVNLKTNGSLVPANQTDKEKGGTSEADSLRASPIGSSGGAATIPQTARQGKYAEVSSPTLRRLFGGKAKQAPVTTAESLKNSVVISNPHATLGHHTLSSCGPLDSSGGSEQASSPGSVYSGTGTWGTTISSSSALGYPSVSSMHTSSESIDMSVGSGHHRDDTHTPLTRTGSAKTE
ncbi:LOW QUALITY PROTEIN: neuron navigator 2-like, partial [Salminus brasiliensis]|uniref:LOW QUALITY PROTEIN: neuron navigator 2-like n=1 Tax=Salminus brasiliensis TaxID=930266 RepID=UPI003B835C6A